ncbi:MAG TPA: uroporphyrinogen-III synthase [Acidiferrobacterales bacterium]
MAASDGGPLAGVTVLVTRPAGQTEGLAQRIERAGGRVMRFPVLEILDPVDGGALLALIDRLDAFDLAIFISPNAVNKAMNVIRARRALPPGLQVAAVGRGSAKALRHFGVADVIAPSGKFDSEALLALPELAEVHGRRIVIFRGDGGRELLSETLSARGAAVETAECYRRGRPQADTAPLLRAMARGELDVVTVTSVQGLRNLYDLVGKLGQQWLVKTPIVVVSERMAEACRELGFKHAPIVAAEPGDDAILAALEAWRAARNSL